MKRAIIIGATSGIGREVALKLLDEGWRLGIAGRREKELRELQLAAPELISFRVLDITKEDAPQRLLELIELTGGMDLFLQSSGIGAQNRELEPDIELRTIETNGAGFTRMVTAAFRYFREHGGGHLAVISSIAGTKGLGSAPAYSATKRFQNTYIQALAQLAHIGHLNIYFTDIRPGFVDTALLKGDKHYPMQMNPKQVAKHIVHALNHHKRVVVIDKRYAILVFFWRLIPCRIWERMTI